MMSKLGERLIRSAKEARAIARGEVEPAPVFIDGKKAATLRGPNLFAEFGTPVEDHVSKRFGRAGAKEAAK